MIAAFAPTICQICMMLSSDTLAMTHGSFGFQAKSEIFDVCPPWINCGGRGGSEHGQLSAVTFGCTPTSSSGGPSSASSCVCSSPILLQRER